MANLVDDIKAYPIIDYAHLIGFTPIKRGRYYTLKEHDSVIIDVDKNCFWRNSNGVKGSIIDFSMHFENKNVNEAIRDLSQLVGNPSNVPVKKATIQEIPKVNDNTFTLPKADNNQKNVYAYLLHSRKIDKNVVSALIKSKNLYQDVHKNCVFVSYNEQGEADFAFLRGTNTKIKFIGDVENNNYDNCFFLNNNSDSLIVTESVIDSMSVMSLIKNNGDNFMSYNYLAISGTFKYPAVINHLQSKPNIRRLILAVDNDSAGTLAIENIRNELQKIGWSGEVIERQPEHYKDWNEALVNSFGNSKEHFFKEQQEKKNLLMKQVKDIYTTFQDKPELIADYLSFKSKFYNYSVNNSILIFSQNRYATFCASYGGWKEKGYTVKKGEKGLKILVPVVTTLFRETSDGEWIRLSSATPEQKEKIKNKEYETKEITSFSVGSTFDISQTNCPSIDYPKFFSMGYESKKHAELGNRLCEYSEKALNCPVIEKDLKSISLLGFYTPSDNTITLNNKLNDTERLSVLTHELGHAIIHNNVKDKPLVSKIEVEGDAFSIMLQSSLGIEVTDNRKRHLVSHCQKIKEYNEKHKNSQISLDDILNDVSEIYSKTITTINEYLDRDVSAQKTNSIADYCNRKYKSKSKIKCNAIEL